MPTIHCWDEQFIIDTFLPITQLAGSQEVLWFISDEMNAANYAKTQHFVKLLIENMGTAQMVITNLTDLRIMQTASKRNYIAFVLTTGPNDPIMLVHHLVLLGRHLAFNVVVMVYEKDDFAVVEDFIHDFKRRNFINIILYMPYTNGSHCLWGYELFPRFNINNRTQLLKYLAKTRSNILGTSLETHGFKFLSPLGFDIPHVFPYTNRTTGKTERQGIGFRIVEDFIKYVNGSLVSYEMPPDKLGGEVIDMKAALQLVRDDKILFLAHAYALYAIDDEIDKSYPITVVQWCLMVPIWNKVSTFYYTLQPFHDFVWYAFIGTFFALLVTDGALIWWQHVNGTQVILKSQIMERLWKLIIDDFCFVTNMSTGSDVRLPSSVVRTFLYLTVFFYGFFVSANYTSLLGSILTVTLFREDINTMKDLIRANITVMIIDYEYEFLLAGGNDLEPDFLKLILPVDAATFNKHQLALNSSYAYFVTDDKWHFIEHQQIYLKPKIFKFTDICFGSYHLVYPMRPDCPIWRNLKYYTHRMLSGGMLEHYERMTFDYAVSAGIMKRLTVANEYTSAGMQHLFMVFILLLLMLFSSFIIFLIECGIYKYNKVKRGLEN